ncbi:MAG: DNA translocase FtsK 4TM domain-containing protein [Cardiobacteriaceae bacterium]|nr:DNA translocase FtsK 4TM domain-containing protein [Cardiobacteriaceae bacterium]
MPNINNSPNTHHKQQWNSVFHNAPLSLIPLVIGVLLLAICLGYNPADPGWTSSGTNGKVSHWGGSLAAYIADFLFSIFGYAIYVLAAGLIAIPTYVFRKHRNNMPITMLKGRWICLVACFVVTAMMFSLRFPKQINEVAITYGGVVGHMLNGFLMTFFSANKLMFIYSLISLFCITAIFDIRWGKICQFIGDVIFKCLNLICYSAMPKTATTVVNSSGKLGSIWKNFWTNLRTEMSKRGDTDNSIDFAIAAEQIGRDFADNQSFSTASAPDANNFTSAAQNNNIDDLFAPPAAKPPMQPPFPTQNPQMQTKPASFTAAAANPNPSQFNQAPLNQIPPKASDEPSLGIEEAIVEAAAPSPNISVPQSKEELVDPWTGKTQPEPQANTKQLDPFATVDDDDDEDTENYPYNPPAQINQQVPIKTTAIAGGDEAPVPTFNTKVKEQEPRIKSGAGGGLTIGNLRAGRFNDGPGAGFANRKPNFTGGFGNSGFQGRGNTPNPFAPPIGNNNPFDTKAPKIKEETFEQYREQNPRATPGLPDYENDPRYAKANSAPNLGANLRGNNPFNANPAPQNPFNGANTAPQANNPFNGANTAPQANNPFNGGTNAAPQNPQNPFNGATNTAPQTNNPFASNNPSLQVTSPFNGGQITANTPFTAQNRFLNTGAFASNKPAVGLYEAENYQKPSLDLLGIAPHTTAPSREEQFNLLAPKVEEALRNYRLDVKVVDVYVGPVVTRLELELAPGIKVSKIVTLEKDIARSLAVRSVRIVEVIPGKPYIGLEIPNQNRQTVYLREILESENYQQAKSPLTAVLGVGIDGSPAVADVAKMPHLLIAGTTGSGKSVAINVMLSSMLYKATPEELRLILVDPKMLELNMYNDIPHLLTPVVDDMEQAENALRWAVAEMERRYQLMAAFKVRKITEFNQKIAQVKAQGGAVYDPTWQPDANQLGLANKPPEIEALPYIVIVIDELADMMMSVGKKVEPLIVRIAQKARAAGIHLILATQRPSVDVITGLIKANVPSRLAFRVSSKYDARTVEVPGAETLLGNGDGLFSADNRLTRIHGAFMKDEEVEALTEYLKSQGQPHYEESITAPVPAAALGSGFAAAMGEGEASSDPESDELYDEACKIVMESRRASISYLQRRLTIGYNRAARIMEAMENAGLVSAPNAGGTRTVLVGGE